ncbi:M35 family metallo-endopeptidase [Paraburkholderia sp. J63]|uniref:M35 family metallo-endopeptidase n=1 Tax=Paraburkholderia sp. J63 TaxID=2805434 RepID=UPI002ABE8591|nr:M35 family metallo-endopeptidase [Paraburkholderia sp. J63]
MNEFSGDHKYGFKTNDDEEWIEVHSSADSDSRVSTVIHEVTHFSDTMATKDNKYTIAYTIRDWAQANSDLAMNNADSVAGYIVEGD